MSNLNIENVFKIQMNGELKDLDPFPSWHEIIVNNIANTSANILQDLQKSQHPPSTEYLKCEETYLKYE